MPLLSAPASKRSTQWVRADIRRYGPNAWETTEPTLVEEMRVALEADMATCRTCQSTETFKPSHATGSVRDGLAWSYRCRSFSRWFNPETRQMEGNSHCTCDGCF